MRLCLRAASLSHFGQFRERECANGHHKIAHRNIKESAAGDDARDLYKRAGVTFESLFAFGNARCDRVVVSVMTPVGPG
ncbi:MAG: hypothetical protein ACXW29_01515 [Thermoanaerobaculia bacterium]